MIPYIKDRWFLFFALIIFVIAKVPHLYYPFYWDESYVYAPAIHKMYEHGPSLLPGAVPLQYSTGHPLLFYASCAAWMKIFGTSNFTMHCFALAVSCLLAFVMYEVLFRLFNKTTAIIGLSLLLGTMHFFEASSMVVSDMTIALLAFLSLYFYAKKGHILAALFLTLLFFAKEAGWVVGILIAGDIVVLAITKKETAKELLLKCISVTVPAIFLLFFFMLQKKTFGWYLYPLHTRSFDLKISDTFLNLRHALNVMFYEQHIYYYYIPLLLLAVWAAVRQRKWLYLLPVLFITCIYALVLVFSYKDVVYYVCAGIVAVLFPTFYLRRLPDFNSLQERFIKLTGAFCLLFLYFCCVNFYEGRYVFPALFTFLLLLSVCFDWLIAKTLKQALRIVVPVVIVIAGLINISVYGGELVAYQQMDVQRHLVDYFENNNFYDRNISCSFLEHVHLTDPHTGFLRSTKVFSNVREQVDGSASLIVIDDIDTDGQFYRIRSDSSFHQLHRYQNGEAWVEVYERL
jgi:hypothetical protein